MGSLTIKTISGSYTGYVLASQYIELDLTTLAYVGKLGVASHHDSTISNAGTIAAAANINGVYLDNGAAGLVINRQTGFVGGYNGVVIQGAARVVNYGTIRAGYQPVFEKIGGSLVNGSYAYLGATMAGRRTYFGGVATVTNFGTLSGVLDLKAGGTVTNGGAGDVTALMNVGGIGMAATGTVANFGTIQNSNVMGHLGVSLGVGGSVTNGSALDRGALIDGYGGIGMASGVGTVSNFGTIAGLGGTANHPGFGIDIYGGTVINGGGIDRTATIEGGNDGVVLGNGGGAVKNFGTVLGVYTGVAVLNGTLTNGSLNNRQALIEGNTGALLLVSTATNYGTIFGAGDTGGWGAYLGNAASFTNGAAGDAEATVEGFVGVGAGTFGPAQTVTNFGTISGAAGVAVQFLTTGDVLAVEAGATFIGAVDGGGGTLDLASGTGAITSLLVGGNVKETGSTTTFANFGALEVGPGASFTVSGNGSIAAAQGLIVAGTLTEAGTLTIAGSLTTTGTLTGAGALALTGGTSNFDAGTALTIAKVTQSGGTADSGSTALTYAGVWTQTAGTLSADAGDRFSFSGVGDTFAGTLAGAGTITFNGGTATLTGTTLKAAHVTIGAATVTLSGTISNASAVSVADPNVIVAGAGASLTGAGSINLSNSAANTIKGATAGSTLTNIGNKITGAGALGGGSMVLVNQAGGTVNGNLGAALIIDTGAATITNAGLIENTGSGGTTIQSAVANSGTLTVTKGVLTVNGAVSGAGTVRIAGGVADFAATFSENVSFTSTTGVLELVHSMAYGGSIRGFSKTGTTSLDLVDIDFVNGTTKTTYVGTTASGLLTVTDGTNTAKIAFTGNYTAATWIVSSDGHGGTTVVDPTRQVTPPRAPLLPFIAATAGFGAKAAASATLSGGSHELRPALAAPRAHLA